MSNSRNNKAQRINNKHTHTHTQKRTWLQVVRLQREQRLRLSLHVHRHGAHQHDKHVVRWVPLLKHDSATCQMPQVQVLRDVRQHRRRHHGAQRQRSDTFDDGDEVFFGADVGTFGQRQPALLVELHTTHFCKAGRPEQRRVVPRQERLAHRADVLLLRAQRIWKHQQVCGATSAHAQFAPTELAAPDAKGLHRHAWQELHRKRTQRVLTPRTKL